jgi:hypothetical protein
MKKVIHLEKIRLKCDACEWEYEKPVTLSREWIGHALPKMRSQPANRGRL